MIQTKILIAEDEERLRKLVTTYLKRENYKVLEAKDGKEALKIWEEEKVDFVILDVMMPFVDGWSVCREIRRESDIPIIMLTARGQESDKLFGFDLGVDDYVTKPFSVKELVARVKALLKRSGQQSIKEVIQIGSLSIDPAQHQVFINGQAIDLSPKEYDLLYFMMVNKNQALTRDAILNGVWGYDYYGDLRTVDTHIKRLRKKLEDFGDTIVTVRGIGYRLEVKA
ncbi:response regulator transcription factor [Clostridiaceae bacterium 35-E11]